MQEQIFDALRRGADEEALAAAQRVEDLFLHGFKTPARRVRDGPSLVPAANHGAAGVSGRP